MCGVCGIVRSDGAGPDDERLVEMMCDELRHRGPDDHGMFAAPGVVLGHRRLSIIDLDTGAQPMSINDGALTIVFNGEIYNYRELRDQLAARGRVFRTKSDTEVILHLYDELGVDCLQHLRGMFAFAIWDAPRRRLFAARDRLGKKPLFYHCSGDRFVFASELAALLHDRGVPRKVSLTALHDFLTFQYVPQGECIFEGVEKLQPAHYLLFEGGRVTTQRYWRVPFQPEKWPNEQELCAAIRETLTEATRLRLVSDVPLGAFLSGGIDSSIVVGLMSRLMGEPVKTFSIGFPDPRYDELGYARIVAKHFRTEHHEFVVEPRAIDILPELVRRYGEPFGDSSAIPTYYVAKMTRQHVTVALTGDAGDECFAGYPRYRAVRVGEWFDRLPGWLRGWLAGPKWGWLPASAEPKTHLRRARKLAKFLNLTPRERYLQWIAIFDHTEKLGLYSDDVRGKLVDVNSLRLLDPHYEPAAGSDLVGATAYVDMNTYLPDDLLVKVDIATMCNSLEARSPFLDHKVVELAGRIPTRLKLRGLQGKYILKRAFADMLPAEIVRRPKMGFGVPIAGWLRGELAGFARDILLSRSSTERGLFSRWAVQRLLDEHMAGRQDHAAKLWSLLWFELWCREFLR
jgi:asparagine synthase (glutamine-hydrolysing)